MEAVCTPYQTIEPDSDEIRISIDEHLSSDQIQERLKAIEARVDQLSCPAQRMDYAVAGGCGLLCALLDSYFVGSFSLQKSAGTGQNLISSIVKKTASFMGCPSDNFLDCVTFLEKRSPIPADSVTNQFGGGSIHHLNDFSHHFSPAGLICSVLTQFTGCVYGLDSSHQFQAVKLPAAGQIYLGNTVTEKLKAGIIDWILHLASDVSGSSSTLKKAAEAEAFQPGTGIPGFLASSISELAALPIFQNLDENSRNNLYRIARNLFTGNSAAAPGIKVDVRAETGVFAELGKQAFSVKLNTALVEVFHRIRVVLKTLHDNPVQSPADLTKLNWKTVFEQNQKTLNRMRTVSSLSFTVLDLGDAAAFSAAESCLNWAVFSAKFVSRINFVGLHEAYISIKKEVPDFKEYLKLRKEQDHLEAALVEALEIEFIQIEQHISSLFAKSLMEDLKQFQTGLSMMNAGLKKNDDLFISGSVIIQEALGYEGQFINTEEFDDLMDSDEPFVF